MRMSLLLDVRFHHQMDRKVCLTHGLADEQSAVNMQDVPPVKISLPVTPILWSSSATQQSCSLAVIGT
jgi:hypothetical protein